MDAVARGARSRFVTPIVGLTLCMAMTDCTGPSEADGDASSSLPAKGVKGKACGDGACAGSETCATCPADCGSCSDASASSSAASGAGAGATTSGSTGAGGAAVGEEQRCKDLGGSCICSEPMNTNLLPNVGDAWQNPSDSTTRECTMLGDTPAAALERPEQDLFGSDEAAVLAALPPGNSVGYFVRAPDGHQGMWGVGHYPGVPSQFEKRAAARWYIYHSPDYEFAFEGTCTNSKFAQFQGGVLDASFGYVHMYNFLDWAPSSDCCMVGPGPSNLTKEDWRGKWWRAEVVFTNLSGPGFVAKVYLKNITDGLPEMTVVDLEYGPTYSSQNVVEWAPSATLTPPVRQDKIYINNFRWADPSGVSPTPTGVCAGWRGVSHYMVAGWDTDEGQRIGAAVEVEGPNAN